jgi:hypothetical protein
MFDWTSPSSWNKSSEVLNEIILPVYTTLSRGFSWEEGTV